MGFHARGGRQPAQRVARLTTVTGWVVLLAVLAAGCGSSADGGTTTSADAAVTTTTGATGEGRVVQEGDTIAVQYTGKLESGEVFDSSVGGDPLVFTVGSEQLIDGFDRAVLGLAVGESITVVLPPDQAYGERSDEYVLDFPLENAPEGLAVGDQVQLSNGAPATVVAIGTDTVTIDANSPLAGETLTFDIEVVEIQ